MSVNNRSRLVCLLGGTGFVGRSLAALLVQHGYDVRIPTRDRARHRELLVLPGVDLVTADVHDERRLTQLLRGCSIAINLVGILNERGHDGAGFRHAHVELAEKLVRACHEANVGRLLQMSALKANAERGASHYLRTKGQAEQVIKDLAGEEISYTLFRPSVIFGAGDTFTNRFARLLKLAPVLPLPRAEARFAPVYVEDVARAFLAALEDSESRGRTYELCGPDIFSLLEIVQFLARELGLKRAIWPLPEPLGRMQAWVGDYLLPGKPISLDNFRSLGVASVCSEDGLAALGIKPTSMEGVVPSYLRGESRAEQLARLRENAGR